MNAAGLALLKEFERGCDIATGKLLPVGVPATKAYDDGGGVWTISWGLTGPDIAKGTVWTGDKAEARFAERLGSFEKQVRAACLVEPNENQLDAMTCLAFNIGMGWKGKKRPGDKDGFRQSTVLRMHNDRKFAEAGAAFGMWNKDNGQVRAGLTRRRAAEAALYLTPVEADTPQTTRAIPDSSKDPSVTGDAVSKTAAMLGQGSALVAPLLAYSPIWDAVSDRVTNPTYLIWGAGVIVIGLLAYNSYMTYRRRQEGDR